MRSKLIIRQKLSVVLIYCLALLSCDKIENSDVPTNLYPKDFNEIFERFFAGMNSNYAFWDVDRTNWDSLYLVYKPLFRKLDLAKESDLKTSVHYFKELTQNLIDSHYEITFLEKTLKDSTIYPAYSRKIGAGEFRNKYDLTSLDTKYFDGNFLKGNYYYTEGGIDKIMFTRLAQMRNGILYFHLNHFALTKAVLSNDESTKQVMEGLSNYLDNVPKSAKGLIVDLRGNDGGDVADLRFMLSKFVSGRVDIGYIKYKNGGGRLDFSPWIKSSIDISRRNQGYNLPIVVLVDAHTASLAELFTISIDRFQNHTVIIGERTWGATSPLASNIVYGYGSFDIPGFCNVTMAAGQFKSLDEIIYEGVGVMPDILEDFSLTAYKLGIDNQLEKAIEYLSNH